MTIESNVEAARGSGWIGRYFELELAQFYHAVLSAGASAVDGGSNAGLHAIGMALSIGQRPGLVYAFEPIAELIQGGMGWAKKMGLSERIRFVNAALGAEDTTTVFYSHRERSALSSLRKMDMKGAYDAIEVKVLRADTFLADANAGRIGFIKLDLEGGEYHALLGLRETIARDRPIVCFENAVTWAAQRFGYPATAILDFFEALDYEVFDFFGTRMTRENFSSPKNAFMYVAGSRGSDEIARLCAACVEFWTDAGSLDLGTWQMTMTAVIEAARARSRPA